MSMTLHRPSTLAELHVALWQELTRAPRDKHHEWRTPVLATVDGDVADARTVVLREVDAASSTLLFFSDARAGKVEQLEAAPLGTVVMWSRRLSWQLRLRVALSAETDGLAVATRWAQLWQSPAAQDYLSPLPPGAEVAGTNAPDETAALRSAPPERGHFAVLRARVLSTDWLELHREGHRRARFDADGARWLVP
jgi:pyridoxamine 5'-phosphate oxidase